MSWEAEEAFLIPFQLVQTQAGRVRPAKDGFLQARKHPPADFTPKSPRRELAFLRRESIWGGKKGGKRVLGEEKQPRVGILQQQEVSMGPGEHAP